VKIETGATDIPETTKNKVKPLCDKIKDKNVCYKTETDASGKSSSIFICTEEKDMIVAYYNETAGRSGARTASTQSPPSFADHSSFCYGSNNSGPFNFKGGFPDMQNPMGPPSGTRGFGL
jgi:hypothetical protein